MLRRLVLLAALAAGSLAHAADSGAAHLNALLQSVSSLQAQFSQQSYDAKGKALQVLGGEMKVKRPGYFRWETLTPSKQLIVANGSVVWIYDPELEQATQQKLDKQVGNTPALLLSGDSKQLDAAFSVHEDAGNAGDAVFTLKPKDKDALFETMRISFHGKELTAMSLQDNLGQKTEIHFDKVKLNPTLASDIFEFHPPKGTDVINETK
jgi:outer membrane lipoprotein carrier protein